MNELPPINSWFAIGVISIISATTGMAIFFAKRSLDSIIESWTEDKKSIHDSMKDNRDRLSRHDSKISDLETWYAEVRTRIDFHDKRSDEIKQSIADLKKDMDRGFSKLEQYIMELTKELSARIKNGI